jgi:hypothetical protein
MMLEAVTRRQPVMLQHTAVVNCRAYELAKELQLLVVTICSVQ